ncbi:MAG TPA: Hsp20/alpha crystallin family protein [Actinomycetota bacterium]|nr:Hsp20/alpha crystallin family protein [Actinomycetota bacterium]
MRDSKGPFHGFIDTFAEMSRMREHALGGGGEQRTQATAWVPTTDILVRGDDLIIRCELAGVDNDDVEVTLAHNTLWIWGERTRAPEDEVESARFYVRERSTGPFRRSINLPQNIDAGSMRASIEDGLLEITIGGAAVPGDVERIAIERRGDDDSGVRVTRG